MMTTEEKKHKTPLGGDRSIAIFTNDKGESVEKKDATKVEVVEYKGDEVLGRTYLESV